MINKLIKSSYARNVFVLMTGTVFAQGSLVLVLPLLASLYSPADFGQVALYVAVCSILTVLVTGRYELAIMIPAKEKEAIHIVILALCVSALISIALFFIILIWEEILQKLWGNEANRLGKFIYLIPLSTFAIGIQQTLNCWLNRNKLFRDMSLNKCALALGNSSSQLALGIAKVGGGQILGSLLGQILAASLLVKKIFLGNKNLFLETSVSRVIVVGKKFRNFPMFLVPGHLINAFSAQAPAIVLNVFFSANVAGFYMLAERLLSIPIGLVANSIGEVFRQQASSTLIQTGQCADVFLATFKRLFALAFFPFLIVFFIIDEVVVLVFGETWLVTAEYAKILLPMFFSRFVTSPLSQVAIMVQKTKIDLFWQISLLISIGMAIGIGLTYNSVKLFLISYSIGYCMMFWLYFFICYRLSKGIRKESI